MKQIAVILTFPYLGPIVGLLGVDSIYNTLTNAPQRTATFSDGEVAAYYILVPIALIIQILIGIPGNLMIKRSADSRIAILFCALMTVFPLVLIRTDDGSTHFTLSSLFPVIGILALFAVGSYISFYFLHYKKKNTEQPAHGDAEDAV